MSSLNYDNMRGNERLRKAICGMLERQGSCPSAPHLSIHFAETPACRHAFHGLALNPEYLTVSCGCGAVLDQLFFMLCAEGQHVLIPKPYYPAFDNDLAVRNGVIPHGFEMGTGPELVASLDRAWEECGGRVGALLLTNPHNPLGTIYSRSDLAAALHWALGKASARAFSSRSPCPARQHARILP